eukprot:scaffold12563_cov70-Isochrysis_galbana.AAC.1
MRRRLRGQLWLLKEHADRDEAEVTGVSKVGNGGGGALRVEGAAIAHRIGEEVGWWWMVGEDEQGGLG